MARNDGPKEGVDFEWVKGPGGAKTRSFFTMAEKNRRKAEGGGPTKKSGSGSTKKTERTKPQRSTGGGGKVRPKSRPSTPAKASPTTSGGGRSNAGPGGPSTARERAEATVSKSKRRPIGIGRETVRQRRAYDRLNEEAPQTLLRSPSNAESYGEKRRKARHGYSKGGMVKANCGASRPPKNMR